MNTNEYVDALASVMLNVSRINSARINNLVASVHYDDEHIIVNIGRPTSRNVDSIGTLCPDIEFAQYVKHVCDRWLSKMTKTKEGGEA